MKIHFADSEYDLSPDFKQRYKTVVEQSFKEVSELLPFGSPHLNFFIQPRHWGVIDATGDLGSTHNSEFVELAFDPDRSDEILKQLRPTVYHEMNHAARFNIPIHHVSFLDNCIKEGLATVFARDYAEAQVPWADYPAEVTDWMREIKEQGETFNWDDYYFDHPDGRRWIAYKVGTYIVDEAKRNSGQSAIELTKLEGDKIMQLAKLAGDQLS